MRRKRKPRLRRKEVLRIERKKRITSNWVVISMFLLLIFGFTAATLVWPRREFSERENRSLQLFPKPTLTTVLNGEFESDYETYLSDQFPGRDGWIAAKTTAERAIGKDEIKDVYFAKDGYLIESHKGSFTTDNAVQNIERLSAFIEAQQERFGEGHVSVMIIPNAVEVLKEKLPRFAPDSGEAQYLAQIEERLPSGTYFDALSVLDAHKEEYLYYRTDHHWTTLAAFYVYEAWAKEKGFQPAPITDYTREVLTDDFLGTIESKVGGRMEGDTIERFLPKEQVSYTLDYNQGQKTGTDLYDLSMLETKDKYSVFFGGNQPIVTAKIDNGSDKKLLVIKDSYAHCFIPFTFEDYGEVTFLDLRYFNESLNGYLDQNEYTDLLFLYNASGFAEDVSLGRLAN